MGANSDTTRQWERIKTILDSALDLPASERGAHLDTACGDDAGLRAEVLSLCEAHDRAATNDALVSPFTGGSDGSETRAPKPVPVGQRIGAYRLLEVLGRGGMGTVYLAERADGQHQRQVAIKLLHLGFRQHELQRFTAEQQILARLEHPNIARLLDSGTSDDGLPYLIMEYIDGKPVTDYCDTFRLGTADRLALFTTICEAVQFAHRNLVVHRDLKPSNILVDGDGRVTLLDFGIAKLIDERALTDSPLTRTGLRVLTPEYASPEQFRGDPVTTATDVYSLGILLYELLCGHRPYRLARLTAGEVERIVCRDEPPRPSRMISQVTELQQQDGSIRHIGPETISRSRATSPERLRRRLAGDLDIIILTALRKEPERRYGSVEQLADELRRHLGGLPVQARPDTVRYRLSKYVGRHRLPIAAGVLILLSLVAGMVMTGRQAAETQRRFDEVRDLANTLLFDLHDAIRDVPGTTPVRQLLVANALSHLDDLARDAANDPGLKTELAEAYERIGEIQGDPHFANLGDLAGAAESYRRSLALREQLLALNPEDVVAHRALANITGRLAVVSSWNGDNALAIDLSRRSLAMLDRLVTDQPESPDLLQDQARVRSELGWWLIWAGETDPGLAEVQTATVVIEKLLAAAPEDVELNLARWHCLLYLADGLKFGGDGKGALAALEKGLMLLRDLVGRNPGHPRVQRNLQSCLRMIGETNMATDPERALAAYEEALKVGKALYAVDASNHNTRRNLAHTQNSIGGLLLDLDRPQEAVAPLQAALAVREWLQQRNPENLQYANTLAVTHMRLCQTYTEIQAYDEALRHGDTSVRMREEMMAQYTNNAVEWSNLASSYFVLARLHRAMARDVMCPADQAAQSWREAIELYGKGLEVAHAQEQAGNFPDYWRSLVTEYVAERDEGLSVLGIAGRQ
ncbi:MAG: protein kinase [bacterium]